MSIFIRTPLLRIRKAIPRGSILWLTLSVTAAVGNPGTENARQPIKYRSRNPIR
jgi:hypothetical protein